MSPAGPHASPRGPQIAEVLGVVRDSAVLEEPHTHRDARLPSLVRSGHRSRWKRAHSLPYSRGLLSVVSHRSVLSICSNGYSTLVAVIAPSPTKNAHLRSSLACPTAAVSWCARPKRHSGPRAYSWLRSSRMPVKPEMRVDHSSSRMDTSFLDSLLSAHGRSAVKWTEGDIACKCPVVVGTAVPFAWQSVFVRRPLHRAAEGGINEGESLRRESKIALRGIRTDLNIHVGLVAKRIPVFAACAVRLQ
jgi:hypothetical protein